MTRGQLWYRAVYLRSPRWRILRAVARLLARGRCRCGRRATETHHVGYRWVAGWWLRAVLELGDLRPVCRSCHQKIHGKER